MPRKVRPPCDTCVSFQFRFPWALFYLSSPRKFAPSFLSHLNSKRRGGPAHKRFKHRCDYEMQFGKTFDFSGRGWGGERVATGEGPNLLLVSLRGNVCNSGMAVDCRFRFRFQTPTTSFQVSPRFLPKVSGGGGVDFEKFLRPTSRVEKHLKDLNALRADILPWRGRDSIWIRFGYLAGLPPKALTWRWRGANFTIRRIRKTEWSQPQTRIKLNFIKLLQMVICLARAGSRTVPNRDTYTRESAYSYSYSHRENSIFANYLLG